MTESNLLLCDRPGGGVALLTLNRPQQRNALSAALRGELQTCLAELEADAQIGAVVLTGAGESFCAGFDLKELEQGDAPTIFAQARSYHRSVYTFSKPLVAAVNGSALAGGMDLACMCDVRLATATAEFGQPQVRRGIPAAYDLIRTVLDESSARYLCLTGARLSAVDALARGLVTRTYDDRRTLLEAAITLGTELTQGGGRGAIKRNFIASQPRLFDA